MTNEQGLQEEVERLRDLLLENIETFEVLATRPVHARGIADVAIKDANRVLGDG